MTIKSTVSMKMASHMFWMSTETNVPRSSQLKILTMVLGLLPLMTVKDIAHSAEIFLVEEVVSND
jgi:hypothetical protein